MRRVFVNEKGLTLVEILAVIVIAAIFLLLISSVLAGVQDKYKEQSREAAATFDVTYAAKVITKDFRKAEAITWRNDNEIKMQPAHADKEIVYRYEEQANILYRNDAPLVQELAGFSMQPKGRMYVLTIQSESGQTIKTELTQRK